MSEPRPVPAGAGPAASLPTGWRKWVLGARPRTLPAAVAPVIVGTAAAAGPSSLGVARGLSWWIAGCALGVAISVQVATNYANDYADGRRGTDDPSSRVGPPRLVGNGLASPEEVKTATIAAFVITALFGLPLVVFVEPWLVVVGIAAMAAGWFYTGGPRPYGYAGFGEAFVFVFFGLVATTGSTYVQILGVPWISWVAAVIVGSFATALLVVNNLRDIPGDTRSEKRTLAVHLGDRGTRWLYLALLVLPFLLLPIVAGLGGRPLAALGLVGVVLARRPVITVLSGAQGPALIPVLAATAQVQIVTCALVALGLFVGG